MQKLEDCKQSIGPYPCCSIITGDAKELVLTIPNESIDLIFTDPIYECVNDYQWLAETAVRILKPNGACLVWLGTPYLDKILRVMCPPLNYSWLLSFQWMGGCKPGRTGICVINECLWLEKGRSKPNRRIADLYRQYTNRSLPDPWHGHQWSKPLEVIYRWVDVFSNLNNVIFDPFCGSGGIPMVCKMLNRHFLAFEIDPKVAERAKRFIQDVQPPLFISPSEQTKLEF